MNHNLKLVEPTPQNLAYLGPFHEIAVHVRDLLSCDYALVATAENDSIRIRAVSGTETGAPANLAVDLISKLGGWGPVVVDDARLVAVPVMCGNDHVVGLLVGYSSKPGRFTGEDLEKLMAYSHVAVQMLVNANFEPGGGTRNSFNTHELLHFSRLITIGELSACFAHEVTNPLMLIRGHLRFVEESLPPDHALRINFEVIDRASRRIEEMAKRMLDFSRNRTPRTEPADVAEVISDALRFVQPYFRTQYIDVQVHLEQKLPIVHLDRWQLVQAIVNLLQNAADAMVESTRRALNITARTEDNSMRIAVTDTGTGISSGNVSRIFDPFFTTKGERGTGLGLYITKQVIEEHGGTIAVHTGDRGTTFVISLPL
jgi:signal transduction histidine kinase